MRLLYDDDGEQVRPLNLLKWVHQHVSPHTLVIPWRSARHGHVHILQWLHDSGVMHESDLVDAMQAAVKFAHLDVLRWYEEAYGQEYICSFE